MYIVNVDWEKNIIQNFNKGRAEKEWVLSWAVILETHKTTVKDVEHHRS